jgi:archaellum component FlaC
MIMEAMREAWTDERLDDLTTRMDRGFAQAEARTDRFEDRIDARFDQMEDRFDKVDARFEKADKRFEKIDARFEKVDQRFERFEERVTMRFEWLWRLMLGGYIAFVLGLVFG